MIWSFKVYLGQNQVALQGKHQKDVKRIPGKHGIFLIYLQAKCCPDGTWVDHYILVICSFFQYEKCMAISTVYA